MLSRAITLVESSNPEHRSKAREVINACLPHSGQAKRIGITGVPGVGKSTFIESFGLHLVESGLKVAVLAIDPSSQRNKGSILGDKTRMNELSVHPDAFVRPSPSSGSLGGVANATRETTILCEAAGFDVIVIETVGVGQSETTVKKLVDFFLLLMLSGAGDELQGIKRGIMEMCDALAINKADGNNVDRAAQAARSYRNALHLFPPTKTGWSPKVSTCSALEKKGIGKLWDIMIDHHHQLSKDGWIEQVRQEQSVYWFEKHLNDALGERFYNLPAVKSQMNEIKNRVASNELHAFEAAEKIIADSGLFD